MNAHPIKILLAEDDDGHADLIKRNFERSGILNAITRVSDGQSVLDLISKQLLETNDTYVRDFLVVLDINMPGLSGIEVLKQLKSDPKTAVIPVIMLTTTDDPREIERCYEYGCNVYVTKPVSYEAFIEAIRRLGLFLQVVKLP